MEAVSSSTIASGSSKRGRTPSSSGSQLVSCVVDGCKSDLSKCRDYHRRHKVCEVHSKTPCVTIRGLQQRFCQQCSRFHSLDEFDEGKRSCRKRLEGHNRRRRKPQPEPLPVNPGNFLSASHGLGNRFLPFNNQPMNPATSSLVTSTSSWSEALKTESNPTLYTSSISTPYSYAYKGRQFPFLQAPNSPFATPGASSATSVTFHHSNLNNNNNNNNNDNNNQDMLCNGLSQMIDSESSCALSLLSSSSAETPEMGLGRVMDHSPMGPSQWAHNILPYPTNTLQGLGLEEQIPNSERLCQGVFQQGKPDDGSSTSGGHQTLSFSWE